MRYLESAGSRSIIGYDWEEVTGDNDPPYANDESIERPFIESQAQANR